MSQGTRMADKMQVRCIFLRFHEQVLGKPLNMLLSGSIG